jgi:asparagine synthase (glutamine-hydrolysing)
MCGISCISVNNTNSYYNDDNKLRKEILKMNKTLNHRGPDYSGCKIIPNKIGIGHTRLAIVGVHDGTQPLVNDDGTIILSVNGEIYNYKELKKEFTDYNFKTESDCEVIIPLYLKYGHEFINKLDGMFSFILYDTNKDILLIVRDHMGITSLYYGYTFDGAFAVASEMKALVDICIYINTFQPGYMYYKNKFIQWYKPKWINKDYIPVENVCLQYLKKQFEKAVKKRMMTEVPYGLFLSGGLDSSLVASIVARNSKEQINTFSIGIEGSHDLKSAQIVAKFLNTKHHSFTYTIQEGIDALEDIIYHLETYDVTTIRSSIPMYILSKKIKAMGFKMVLSGEGSDEEFGGYLYFHKAPNQTEFHQETIDKLMLLYKYDCLRANKATAAIGLETRVPFLDKCFLNYVMSIDPKNKMINKGHKFIEKYILRKAFDNKENPYLPDEILWRRKEQFSDGVSSNEINWIKKLEEYANEHITYTQMKLAHLMYEYNTPLTKEAFLYRTIFTKYFPTENMAKTVHQCKTIACSTERAMSWDPEFLNNVDPSGSYLRNLIDNN